MNIKTLLANFNLSDVSIDEFEFRNNTLRVSADNSKIVAYAKCFNNSFIGEYYISRTIGQNKLITYYKAGKIQKEIYIVKDSDTFETYFVNNQIHFMYKSSKYSGIESWILVVKDNAEDLMSYRFSGISKFYDNIDEYLNITSTEIEKIEISQDEAIEFECTNCKIVRTILEDSEDTIVNNNINVSFVNDNGDLQNVTFIEKYCCDVDIYTNLYASWSQMTCIDIKDQYKYNTYNILYEPFVDRIEIFVNRKNGVMTKVYILEKAIVKLIKITECLSVKNIDREEGEKMYQTLIEQGEKFYLNAK